MQARPCNQADSFLNETMILLFPGQQNTISMPLLKSFACNKCSCKRIKELIMLALCMPGGGDIHRLKGAILMVVLLPRRSKVGMLKVTYVRHT
jgi:hypothetical protein